MWTDAGNIRKKKKKKLKRITNVEWKRILKNFIFEKKIQCNK